MFEVEMEQWEMSFLFECDFWLRLELVSIFILFALDLHFIDFRNASRPSLNPTPRQIKELPSGAYSFYIFQWIRLVVLRFCALVSSVYAPTIFKT